MNILDSFDHYISQRRAVSLKTIRESKQEIDSLLEHKWTHTIMVLCFIAIVAATTLWWVLLAGCLILIPTLISFFLFSSKQEKVFKRIIAESEQLINDWESFAVKFRAEYKEKHVKRVTIQ